MSQAQTSTPLVANTPERPRIYVACLASYNNGVLHGQWIAADNGVPHIREKVRAMLASSPVPGAEEWAIHDYDGFEGACIEEYLGFETVSEIAEFVGEYGELGAVLLDYFGNEVAGARAAFEDYAGTYDSAADFAEQLHEEVGTEIPQSLSYYIDWQSLGRDMALNGDITLIELSCGVVHIFRNN